MNSTTHIIPMPPLAALGAESAEVLETIKGLLA